MAAAAGGLLTAVASAAVSSVLGNLFTPDSPDVSAPPPPPQLDVEEPPTPTPQPETDARVRRQAARNSQRAGSRESTILTSALGGEERLGG